MVEVLQEWQDAVDFDERIRPIPKNERELGRTRTMPKTAFSDKCDILATFLLASKEMDISDDWRDFIVTYDIGLPVAFAVANNIATLIDGMDFYIEDTWDAFCSLLGLDPDLEYSSLTDMFSTSMELHPRG